LGARGMKDASGALAHFFGELDESALGARWGANAGSGCEAGSGSRARSEARSGSGSRADGRVRATTGREVPARRSSRASSREAGSPDSIHHSACARSSRARGASALPCSMPRPVPERAEALAARPCNQYPPPDCLTENQHRRPRRTGHAGLCFPARS
jgi:hypothetical protein